MLLGVVAPRPTLAKARDQGSLRSALAVAFKQTKHILRAAEFLRDLVAREVIVLRHLPGKVMIADLLTKSVARVVFHELLKLLDAYSDHGVACPTLSS